jgi:hypothetical protein
MNVVRILRLGIALGAALALAGCGPANRGGPVPLPTQSSIGALDLDTTLRCERKTGPEAHELYPCTWIYTDQAGAQHWVLYALVCPVRTVQLDVACVPYSVWNQEPKSS